jgi:uncharacterized membrane protein
MTSHNKHGTVGWYYSKRVRTVRLLVFLLKLISFTFGISLQQTFSTSLGIVAQFPQVHLGRDVISYNAVF